MDNNTLKINTDFFANNGAIGRREYFINILILSIITTLLTAPFNIWSASHSVSIQEYFDIHNLYFKAPIAIQILFLVQASFSSVIGISNIKRRLNDIFGYENQLMKYIIATIYVFCAFSFFLPTIFSYILPVIIFIINIFLLFKKGKITSQLPIDELKKFNWGAFLGTWIWGLINKVYQPLWMLLLWFTPFSLYFAIYCGFKGNRWAYDKNSEDDVEKFSQKQSNQAFFFTILHIILAVLLPIVLSVIISISVIHYATKNPDGAKKLEEVMETFENLAKSYFERYEIGTENKFYINPDTWNYATFDEKRKLLELAAQIAAQEKNDNLSTDDYINRTSKYNELNKTKIYSDKDNKLLAEFYMDENISTDNFKEFIKASINAYKFYR